MTKQIVVCMDGTWNNPVEQTNVYRLFQMLPGDEQPVAENGPIRSHLVKSSEQLAALYLESIGKGGRTQGLLGGTQGSGRQDSITDQCYTTTKCDYPQFYYTGKQRQRDISFSSKYLCCLSWFRNIYCTAGKK